MTEQKTPPSRLLIFLFVIGIIGLVLTITIPNCPWPTPTDTPTPITPTPDTPTPITPTPITPTPDTPSPDSPTPTDPPTPTDTPTPTCVPTIECVDPTTSNRISLSPGESFTKSWTLANTNSCPWPEGYKLIFVNGHQMDGPKKLEIEPLVNSTGTVTVSVPLTAPTSYGTYTGTWQIQDANDTPISEEDLYVSITIPTPRPTPRPQPVYPKPQLTKQDVLRGCQVTFYWSWGRELAENEYFAVRAGISSPGESLVWTKETQFTTSLAPPSDNFVWEVAICQGDPGKHLCEELVASDWSSPFFIGDCPSNGKECPPCIPPNCPPGCP